MSFNPVVYNEGGIFRHSDFVGYLPDYLKSEPDVVTLMQLMSDYINNAYRNIQTTSEFELKRICTETSRARVKREMQKLQTMFELAYSRGESVLLVSSPRNNVKSNFVIGNVGAEYPIEINYAVSEVEDKITGATSMGIGKNCVDGQVVYVNYTNTTPVQKVPYYYDKDTNALYREPMGSSQDPFNGTTNSPNRVIQFYVDMVGKVGTRFARTVDAVDYYEVFFKLHIYNLTDVPNKAVAKYEVDGINTEADDVVIDYCNMSTTSSEKYRATIKFADDGAFDWKAGFPTGIFYFRDSSGAKLTRVGSDTSIMSPDPTLEHTVERYRITGIEVTSGIVKAFVDNYPGQYSYAMCYIVHTESGLILGRYKMDASMASVERFDTGERYVLLTSYDGSDAQQLLTNDGKLELVIIPLFCTKKVINYQDSYKMVKWDNQYPMCGTRTIDSNNVMLSSASISSNYVLAAGFVPSRDNSIGNEFYLNTDYQLDKGRVIFCTNGMWEGLAKILDIPRPIGDGLYAYTLDGTTTVKHSSYGVAGDIYVVTSGMLKIDTDSNLSANGYWEDPDMYAVGDLVLLKAINSDEDPILTKIASVSYEDYHMEFECSTLGCNRWYSVSKVTQDKSVIIDQFVYRNVYTDYTAGAIKWSNGGDVFTQEYMVGYSYETKTYSLFHMITDVKPVKPGSYKEGDFVSEKGQVYRAMKDVILPENSYPSGTPGFAIDRFVHYSVGFKTVNNAFMPYYGQYTSLDFGETPDYGVDMNITTLPLYISKVNDTSLKYGWKDREYMYYGADMDLTTKPRNGFVELYETYETNDIVNNDLANYASGFMDYPFVKHGVARILDVDIDNSLSAVNNYDGTWTVTVQSSDHGLVNGAEISISGITCSGFAEDISYADLVFNREYVNVKVIDGDNFSYTVTPLDNGGNPVEIEAGTLIGGHQHSKCVYCRDYRYDIVGLQVSEDGKVVRIEGKNIGYHNDVDTHFFIVNGSMTCISNEDVDDANISGEYVAIEDPNANADDRDRYICLENVWNLEPGCYYAPKVPYARITVPVVEGDLVFDGTDIYKVSNGIWPRLDRHALSTPFTIFSRHNFFDITKANPELGRGAEHIISQLQYTGKGRALVIMRNSLDFVTAENAKLIEGRTEVYIKNVYPTHYCGWHTITKVYGPGVFEIAVKDVENVKVDGTPVENRQMTLQAGTWYRYTVTAHDWDKMSNCATYSSANVVTNIRRGDAKVGENAECTYVYTNMEHHLNVGDYILFDLSGNACYTINASNYREQSALFKRARVKKVVNDRLFLIDYDETMLPLVRVGISTVFRGYILGGDGNTYDHLEMLRDEYTKKLYSYGNTRVRFLDGDVVVTLGQTNVHEIAAWRVVDDASWIPIRRKRVVKIRNITVEMYNNPEYNMYDDVTEAVPYKYREYTEVDIAKARIPNHLYYLAPDWFARNYVFTEAALEHLDTTRLPLYEFNSKYDYGTVAPRDFEDDTFQGVPDMKYPLVEKVERLSYLKDMSVLDYDLIGYLARYMGYDITALSSDVDESNVYHTKAQREKAIRETIENLPQYYALGGTKAGVNMLLATFGIIADVLTKWTNTTNPYGELLSEDEMRARVDHEIETKNIRGSWVPTPHIDLSIPLNSNFKNLLMGDEDIAMLKEQIRVFKPINVVFDDVIMTIKCNFTVVAGIACGGVELGSSTSPLLTDDDESSSLYMAPEINYDTCNTLNCVF